MVRWIIKIKTTALITTEPEFTLNIILGAKFDAINKNIHIS